MNTSPQKENGYCAIANEILEALINAGLNGTELACVLLVIRKTYGWNKKEDQISLSQFLASVPVSKPSLCKALNILQLVKIIKLVKKGNSKILSNSYTFNKNYLEWQLVKKTKLVKFSAPTSKDFETQLVKKTLHTKDNLQKTITKDKKVNQKENSNSIQLILDFFNSTCKTELRLTSKKIQQITARRKLYTDDEIKQAIVARTKSPFHCGENSEGKVWYRDWESLFRNDEKIEHALSAEFVKPKSRGCGISL